MIKKAILFFILLALGLSLSACVEYPEYVTDSVFGLDTVITIKVAGQDNAEENMEKCWELIASLDKKLSKTSDSGDVANVNSKDHAVLSEEGFAVLARAIELSSLTGGAFDPTLGTLISLWDVTGNARVPSDAEIADALSHTGADKLTLDPDALTVSRSDPALKVDLGGAGKGYVCQRAVEYLSGFGGYGLVSFGSSIGVFGKKADGADWNIAVTDPYDPANVVGYISIPNGYISVSGDYERYAEIDGVRYGHIIDPSSGRPVDNGVHSVVVWTRNGEEGDVISTALFVLGEDGIEFLRSAGLEFEAYIISDRGETKTEGMEKMFTYTDSSK